MADLTQKTIQDFGEQWTRYRNDEGYYASTEMLQDIAGNLLSVEEIKSKDVLDIGSGTGRIINMLLDAGAAKVTAVEPSVAFEVLKSNTRNRADKIAYLNCRGDEIHYNNEVDYVFSIGVLHHIPDPKPVVDAAFKALKDNGKMLIWLYGYEKNELYLSLILPLRRLTAKVPDPVLIFMCFTLTFFMAAYMYLCKILPLPMRSYMLNHQLKLDWRNRYLTIFDQLNPAEARYYKEAEAVRLLADSGFKNIKTYHRHGYSWTVIGTKE